MKYVMFLRGINVGGIRVPMAALKDVLGKLGLQDVKTYLQTGNVALTSDMTQEKLKAVVEAALTKQFGYTAFVLIYPATVLESIIADYPFDEDETFHRYALFCENQSVIDELLLYKEQLDGSVESIASGKHVVYWRVPKGSTTDTFFSKIISKPKYKATTTNRNINTLEKMAEK